MSIAPETVDATDILSEALDLHKEGRLDQAATLYQSLLRADPQNADALHLLGVVAHQRGDHLSAVERIERALAIAGERASYYSNLGLAYRSLGRKTEAINALRRAVEIEPKSAGFQHNLANALKDSDQFAEAVVAFRASLEIEPQNPDAWTGLGDALRGLGEFAESRRCHDRAMAVDPRFSAAHYNLGLTFADEGDLNEAVACFLRAAALRPDFVEAHLALGNVQEDRGDFRRAVEAYDRALTLDPRLPSARFNRALALLRQGDFVQGWTEYESRWRHNAKPRIFAEPAWDGSPQMEKTILVYSEQGIGDEVMFGSCFGEVIARTGTCLIECDARLARLFARSFPEARVFSRAGEIDPSVSQNLPAFDFQVAAGSLPARLRRNLDDFPNHPGYLVPDRDKVDAWRKRFDELGAGLVVGIAWKGGKDPATRRRRSAALKQWTPLFQIPGIAFVNLQYGDCESEIDECRQRRGGTTLHRWADLDPFSDLDGLAAQIAALDLVISVDNATVHLAGALNQPVWAFLPFASDWRWFQGREDSPWYPSLRLFRQSTAVQMARGDWSDVIGRAAAALTDLAELRSREERRRAVSFHRDGHLAEAIHSYLRAAALRPGDAETLNDLGVAWREGGRSDLAIAAYRRAIDARPELVLPWFNLGNAYREENQLEKAVDCYEQARLLSGRSGSGDRDRQTMAASPVAVETDQQLDDSNPASRHPILVNLSVALRDLRRLDEATACLDEVLRTSPELPEARFDRSLIDLLRGDFEQGWDEYEWRLQHGPSPRTLPLPRWDGRPPGGRSIVILAEQGIGDQVMFGSCLPQLAADAASCVVECDPRLVPLFARSFPGVTPIGRPADPLSTPEIAGCQVYDYLGSLPRSLRRRIDDFPPTTAYLKPHPELVAKWRAHFARLGGALKVGISWRGGKDAETRRQRSIPLEKWGPIVQVPGVRFVNLQYGPSAAEAAVIRDRFNVPLDDGADCDPLTDLDDFTAKLAALDLVLSVDNSTVHLAAAIGRPVWTLLPFSSDWRWGLEGEATPWYPTMRLLRCSSRDEWPELLRRAARQLTSAAFSRDLVGR